MSDTFLADCKRCDQPVDEAQPYVMVVNVGRERTYFHAGCEPMVRPMPDLAQEKIRTANEA